MPKNGHTQPNTVLLTESGVYCFLLRCKRPAAKPFMTWVVKTVLPREVRRLNGQLKDKDATIELKDSAIALLNDDLETTQQQVLTLNEQLEVQDSAIALLNDELETLRRRIEQLERRAVPYLEDQNNNGIVIIQKNNGDTYPYVAICGQQGYITQKLPIMSFNDDTVTIKFCKA